MTDTELDVTIARVTQRRADIDDRDRELLSDDPREVRAYLREHVSRRIPEWVQRADIADIEVIDNRLWWTDRLALLADLLRGRALGITLLDLGTPLGITSPQGTQDLIDRLSALKQFHRPDEKLTRAKRRAPAVAGQADPVDPKQAWLRRNHDDLVAAASTLLAEGRAWLSPAAQEQGWSTELAADLAEDIWTPGTMGVFSLVAGEVRTAPDLADLPKPPLRTRTVLREVDRLRTAWAALT